MTDEKTPTPAHGSTGSIHGTPHRLTAEQVAAMSEDEKLELIAELEASLEELRRPIPQPYPKWVEIDGVSQVVESADEEQRKTKAAADFHKEQKKHDHEHEDGRRLR